MKFFRSLAAAVFLAFVSASCATMADYDFSSVDGNLGNGNYEAVQKELEKNGGKIYSSHDSLLRLLDGGILNHYAGDFSESNRKLSESEALFEKFSARSVSQTVASFMTNDLAMDYSGEDFENIYANIFMALNYIQQGNEEDAMVEVRRFDNKLKVLKSKYEKEVQSANSKQKADGVKIEKVSIKFSDSALARYLSMLLYRSGGDISNAQVDLKYLKSAFGSQKTLYDFPVPSTVDGEVGVPKNQARINLIALYGKSPVKVESVTRVYYPYAGIWYKLALPQIKKRGSEITKIDFTVSGSGGNFTGNLEKIESIENIAQDTFSQRLSVITAKSLARSIARAATSGTMDALSDKAAADENYGASLLFALAGLASKIHTEAAERADTRSSRYFPASAAVSGITVPPGEYSVQVRFWSGNRLVRSEIRQIDARAGKINLVESECLK